MTKMLCYERVKKQKNLIVKGEIYWLNHEEKWFFAILTLTKFNPQPFTSYANFGVFQFKNKYRYDVKNMDKWGYNYLIDLKALWDKEKLLVTSNFCFSDNVFKSCLVLVCQNEYLWSKGLKLIFQI